MTSIYGAAFVGPMYVRMHARLHTNMYHMYVHVYVFGPLSIVAFK